MFILSHEKEKLLLSQMDNYLHGKLVVLGLDKQRVKRPDFGKIQKYMI